MRRLILDPQTSRFLKPNGGWTADENEAMNFNDIGSLLIACSKHKVYRANVFLRFDYSKRNVRLPLSSKILRP